ncbi:hypothetical protein AALP_AAs63193U000200 [Arabis alpina]|uniref:Uncharacterized protein n=1 Tax=Arabis alpina TaxID=50452 RepID=A0A087FXS8_ARAAL|nr:hypothetical protein AALP_AAs63193U000200 [Arabis alpina]
MVVVVSSYPSTVASPSASSSSSRSSVAPVLFGCGTHFHSGSALFRLRFGLAVYFSPPSPHLF